MPDLTRDLALRVVAAIAPEERDLLDAFYDILIQDVAGAAAGGIAEPGFGKMGAGLENDVTRQIVSISHALTRSGPRGASRVTADAALDELWRRWSRLEAWVAERGGDQRIVPAFQAALVDLGGATTDEALLVATALRVFSLSDLEADDADNVLARAMRFDPNPSSLGPTGG
ncbi:hypothetical protein N825_10980 [Skermanella stibiiresistens SB22]|uniref:Uncharacterized protein n=1 Tax=Skermanella stibiiresistens SB22 TaxID=1385369 RepID=W9H1V3_9PROT|nr:hypothetical protein [Skermanella stibiiresistens]EWY38801.1 hypothetical protein N825_10980 [Skermanella stibiiresistens SB22]